MVLDDGTVYLDLEDSYTVYSLIKIHQPVHLRSGYFTVSILYLNKTLTVF